MRFQKSDDFRHPRKLNNMFNRFSTLSDAAPGEDWKRVPWQLSDRPEEK